MNADELNNAIAALNMSGSLFDEVMNLVDQYMPTLNEVLNAVTAREDDDLWITYDNLGPISLHVGPESEFPNHPADLMQINLSKLRSTAIIIVPANDLFRNITEIIGRQTLGVITAAETLEEIEVAIHG